MSQCRNFLLFKMVDFFEWPAMLVYDRVYPPFSKNPWPWIHRNWFPLRTWMETNFSKKPLDPKHGRRISDLTNQYKYMYKWDMLYSDSFLHWSCIIVVDVAIFFLNSELLSWRRLFFFLGRVRPWDSIQLIQISPATAHYTSLSNWSNDKKKQSIVFFFHQFTVYYWILGSKSSTTLSPMIMGQWKMALHRLKGSNSILRIFWDTPMVHWIMIMGGRVSN